ncbi:hypothetical protein LIER_41168 [Lithospermum erythrorhizon]|uniref:Reverse transcriptase domain-containing protein n=1 Tax=Lithospermum erythrorhizon TaxID=34254 RepID=A0AAV3R538_LITER
MLGEGHKESLVSLIREYKDIFAWGPENLLGIETSVALHKLSMYVSIKQKNRTFNDEKNQAVRTEVEWLLKENTIRELQFPKWIANVVLVKKSNGTWRMCTDFTSFNKACPKDFYPLPCLARLVDCSAGYEVFDFMDASQGYNQIKMYPEDEEKTSFITEYGLYCWKVMPFGLNGVNSTKVPRASNSQREFDFPSTPRCNINNMISLVSPHQEGFNQELIYASKQG